MDDSYEAELLARAKNGDSEAFAALVAPHCERLTIRCQRLLNDRGLAEEAVQEALWRAWNRIGRCNENFAGWFYTIALNVARDMRSAAHWRRSVPLDSIPDAPQPADPVDDLVIGNLLLHEILARLNDTEREIFVLHFIEGNDLKKVATELGISHDACRQRWSRLLKKIESFVEPPSPPSIRSQKGDDEPHA